MPRTSQLTKPFDHLAARKAGNADSRDGELLFGWNDSIEVAFMSTLVGLAGGDCFTFGNNVLDCQPNVGERSAAESRTLLFAFRPSPKFGRRRIMVRVVLCEELVCHRCNFLTWLDGEAAPGIHDSGVRT
jgi:hypothetical protein